MNCTRKIDQSGLGRAIRLHVPQQRRISEFVDGCAGPQKSDLAAEWGNPLVFRADGIFNYYLANVVDDCREKITHVVRGADLLGASHVHIFLHKELYNSLPPEYFHVPVVKDERGKKLSKSESSAFLPLERSRIISTLNRALVHLGQREHSDAETAEDLIESAVGSFKCWDLLKY